MSLSMKRTERPYQTLVNWVMTRALSSRRLSKLRYLTRVEAQQCKPINVFTQFRITSTNRGCPSTFIFREKDQLTIDKINGNQEMTRARD